MSSDSPPTPSSRAPAGLPPAGNSKYIVIVILLAIACAGLVAFRMCGTTQPTNPTRPVSTYDAAPISHQDDFVPPPPPPDEPVPEAGAVVRGPSTPFDPCAAKTCSGTSTQDLESALAHRAQQARRCYDAALGQDSELKGHVGLKVRVASNGAVCAADVTSNDMGTDMVAKCVVNTFRASRSFPAPKGNCVDVNLPLSFIPGGK